MDHMKKTLLLSFIVCLSSAVYAQHEGHNHGTVTASTPVPATEAKKPETLILKEESYDFGKIPQGKPVTHIFKVGNAGKEPIKINNVQASCGCTTPEWDRDKDIPVDGETNITVGYNAAAEGPFTKSITITYNETLTKQITIRGEVWKTPAASAPEKQGISELKD